MKKGIETFEDIRGKRPKEAGFDKGYRSKELNDPYLKEARIDNGIQGSEPWKGLPLAKRKHQHNTRAGAEPLMNDIKNHRWANKKSLEKKKTQNKV